MGEHTHSPRIVRFGVFEVDLRAGELRKSGVKIKLQEQPFQILALLLGRPGDVVTREEIQKKLWPDGTFVDFEHSLNAAVKRLREALGDSADNPRFVETLPRRGYKFIYPVEGQAEVAPAAASTWKRWAPALALLAVPGLLVAALALNLGGLRDRLFGHPVPGQITSIAVLPLVNLSGDPEQDYFAAGMHEALITDLAKLGGFKRVIARASVMRYQETDRRLPQIAQELNVDAVLTGSVLRSGDRVRITVQLIDAASEQHLWAERYERDLHDVLSLQNEIVGAIVREIQLNLTPAEETRLASARTVNPEAYEAYLKGRFHANKLTPQDLETAMKYFQRALEKVPNYALAYTGIAFVWSGRQQMGFVPPREATPKAKAAALKALELDDTLAEAHFAMAIIRAWYEWDWAGGEAEFQRAIELNPNYPDTRAFYSHFLMNMRRPEEAMAQIERAMELDPHNSLFQALYGVDLMFVRRYDDAIVQFRNALRTTPNLPLAQFCLWDAFHVKQQDEDALAEAKNAYAALGDSEIVEALERGYAQAGYRGAMRRAAEALAARSPTSYVPPVDVAALYQYAGDNDRALEWLEKAYEARDPNLSYVGLPSYDPLRDDPRFQSLLRRMNLPE